MKTEEKIYCNTLGCKIGRTLKAIMKKLNEELSQHQLDLTVEQMYLLIILNKEEKLIQQDIAEIMAKDKSAVFRQIDSLEKKHLVARMASAEDKRKKVLMLTKEGVEMIRRAKEVEAEVMDEVTRDVDAENLEIFENVLQQIYANALKN